MEKNLVNIILTLHTDAWAQYVADKLNTYQDNGILWPRVDHLCHASRNFDLCNDTRNWFRVSEDMFNDMTHEQIMKWIRHAKLILKHASSRRAQRPITSFFKKRALPPVKETNLETTDQQSPQLFKRKKS